MRKTDKKREHQLRVALTTVCDNALKDFPGFEWLTHLVNYANFPKSLKIVCVFDSKQNLASFMEKGSQYELNTLIHKSLFEIGINIKNITGHISYDTEEDCENSHNGKWNDRLK